MAQPGMPSASGEDWLVREVQTLRRELQELKAANVFGMTGIRPKNGGTEFDGYANFNGNMRVTGTLELPAGIIGNDALSNPSAPYAGHADVANFALAPGANVEKLAMSIPVPTGFTRAHIFAASTMYAYNSNASRDEMYMQCLVNGVRVGYSSEVSAQATSIGFAASNYATVLTGLGSAITVSVVASSYAFAWPADPSRNSIDLNVFVSFLR